MSCDLRMSPIRILVVDDHFVVREGLAVLLDRDAGITAHVLPRGSPS